MYNVFIYILFLMTIAHGTLVEVPKETVNGGEYLYYNVTNFNSYIYLRLASVGGDCDLYVSEQNVVPTFDNYSLHSATCGVDSLIIPKRFKRPVNVGVYGHPAFDKSDCLLSVCLLEYPEKLDEYVDEWTEVSFLSDLLLQSCVADKSESESSYFNAIRTTVDILAWIMSALVTFFSTSDWFLEIITALA